MNEEIIPQEADVTVDTAPEAEAPAVEVAPEAEVAPAPSEEPAA